MYANAQNFKSSISYSFESIRIPKNHFRSNLLGQKGLEFDQNISKSFRIKFALKGWANYLGTDELGNEKIDTANSYSPYYFSGRSACSMLDISLGKSLKIANHEVVVFIGTTYTISDNEFRKTFWNSGWYNGQFYIYDGVSYAIYKKVNYWGLTSQFYYNYYLKNERFRFGFHAGIRYLFEYTKPQFDLGFHAGYNFNFHYKKKK
jgi:hypothetical protein